MKVILIAKNDIRREMPNCYPIFDCENSEIEIWNSRDQNLYPIPQTILNFNDIKQLIFEP